MLFFFSAFWFFLFLFSTCVRVALCFSFLSRLSSIFSVLSLSLSLCLFLTISISISSFSLSIYLLLLSLAFSLCFSSPFHHPCSPPPPPSFPSPSVTPLISCRSLPPSPTGEMCDASPTRWAWGCRERRGREEGGKERGGGGIRWGAQDASSPCEASRLLSSLLRFLAFVCLFV